nr:hypothetical protein [Tanacetum cinerariifolium]
MATTIDQQTALDESLVPSTQRLRIGRSNFRLPSDIQSKESTLQVVYDVLRNSPIFKAFQVTADVPEIYMQEFWATAKLYDTSIRFKLDIKRSILDLEAFKEMLHISPRILNQTFADLPTEEEILDFLRLSATAKGVLDVPSDDSKEELSWNSSDDEDVGDSEEESNDEEDQDLRLSEEARLQEEEDADGLYRDVNINQGRGLQVTQHVEDTHVTLTPVNPDGPQESSSVSSFVTIMLNPTSDVGVESIFTMVDVVLLIPKLHKNRTAHIDYIKHTLEEATTLRELVESERLLSPLNTALAYACKYTRRIQELLMILQQTCPRITDLHLLTPQPHQT